MDVDAMVKAAVASVQPDLRLQNDGDGFGSNDSDVPDLGAFLPTQLPFQGSETIEHKNGSTTLVRNKDVVFIDRDSGRIDKEDRRTRTARDAPHTLCRCPLKQLGSRGINEYHCITDRCN